MPLNSTLKQLDGYWADQRARYSSNRKQKQQTHRSVLKDKCPLTRNQIKLTEIGQSFFASWLHCRSVVSGCDWSLMDII